MGSVIEIRAPDEADRKTVRELFYAMPIMERGAPIFKELLWVLLGRENRGQHVKALPDYCYPIFDALKATYFKNFPALTDIIFIKDKAGLPAAKTVEAAKKVIQMDWRNSASQRDWRALHPVCRTGGGETAWTGKVLIIIHRTN